MKQNEGASYLASYPGLKKWMNTCACCGAVGYKPEMPAELTTRFAGKEIETMCAQNLRRFFQPLKVNEAGLCEVCERLLSSKQR